MKKTSYIHAVISYIEKRLTEELNPENIARRNFISLSQLYRDFYAYTGHSIKEYIRKRRISNACEKIKCSEIPLTIIAGESGCQTQQAFSKQFKSIVGMAPLTYRHSDTYFYFHPFSGNELSLAIKVGLETIPEWTTTKFYDSCLTGIEDKAIAALGEIHSRVFGRNGKQIGNRFCYEVMTEKGITSSDDPGKTGTYASCIVKYNEQDINDGWNYLYNTWLSTSMFEQSGDGYFEEYLFKNGKPHKLKLYLPVIKRKPVQYIIISQIPERAFVIAREKGSNAERRASEKVMGFLQKRYPLLLRNAQHFYVCAYDDVYECGIECGNAFKLPDSSNLDILRVPSGKYAVLPDTCFGDVRVGGAKIDVWLTNNSIAHEKSPVFAVYETVNGSYDADNIRMKLYKRLKDDKNG